MITLELITTTMLPYLSITTHNTSQHIPQRQQHTPTFGNTNNILFSSLHIISILQSISWLGCKSTEGRQDQNKLISISICNSPFSLLYIALCSCVAVHLHSRNKFHFIFLLHSQQSFHSTVLSRQFSKRNQCCHTV